MKSSRPTSVIRRTIPVCLIALAGCRHRSAIATLPPAAELVVVSAGVKFEDAVLTKYPEKERLWIFVPDDKHLVHPCVFVAAEADDPYHGARLREEAKSSLMPYVRAGYTVVAYEVSGAPPAGEDAAQADAAVRLFARREVGTLNGKAAIDYALHHLHVDPIRLYVAGHGAAGTLALQMSAVDSRIRGCLAYSPSVLALHESSYAEDEIGYVAPEALRVIQKFSPARIAGDIQCPVMLYVADDDQGAADAVREFGKMLGSHSHGVDIVGGPAASAVSDGIEWLGRDRRKTKAAGLKASI